MIPNRAWVYAPSPEILRRRWGQLIAATGRERKKELFKESTDRKLATKVGPLPGGPKHQGTIADESGPCPQPARVAYRSFDRQWIIPDNRLLHRPSPDLWRAAQPNQIFVIQQRVRPISSGPGVVFAALIPDVDYFKGSEGGRVAPMLHADGSANVAPRLLEVLGERLGTSVTVQDLVAYVAGVAGHRGFTETFADELTTPGIRVPLTTDPALWAEAVELGREVVWASTYGEAFADPERGRPHGTIRYPSGDERRPLNQTAVPQSPLPTAIRHGTETQTLYVGEGTFAPVPEAVWGYDVGGMQVVKKWFSYRKARPGGKVSSPLDKIHVERWPHEWTTELNDLLTVLRRLVELEPRQRDLLERVTGSEQLTVGQLTKQGVLPIESSDPPRKPRRAPDMSGGLFGD